MQQFEQMIQRTYIDDKETFERYKHFILDLYSCHKLSPFFRMTIREIKNLRNYNQISGMVLSGYIPKNQKIKILPAGIITNILDCSNFDYRPGDFITITIENTHKLTCSGMIAAADSPAQIGSLFRVRIFWTGEKKPVPGRRYAFMFGRQRVYGSLLKIKEFNKKLQQYICNINVEEHVAFDAVCDNPVTGTFIVDSEDKTALCGIGVIEYALRRGSNIHQQFIEISQDARASIKNQKPCVLWMTGLSGAGKSSIANAVEKKLHSKGYHTYLLDGDNVRHGLNKDLGFSEEDRVENIRRVAEVAHLMVDAGLIVMTSFISPFKADRSMARHLFAPAEFLEIYIDTPLEVAEKRDPKGLYAKARKGELKNFTGIDSAYEAPEQPEIRVQTTNCSIDEAAEKIVRELDSRGIIDIL